MNSTENVLQRLPSFHSGSFFQALPSFLLKSLWGACKILSRIYAWRKDLKKNKKCSSLLSFLVLKEQRTCLKFELKWKGVSKRKWYPWRDVKMTSDDDMENVLVLQKFLSSITPSCIFAAVVLITQSVSFGCLVEVLLKSLCDDSDEYRRGLTATRRGRLSFVLSLQIC